MATATQPNVSQQESASPHGQAQGDLQQHEDNAVCDSNERVAYVLGGSFLTILGLRRRSTFGALLAIVGGSLIYKGMMLSEEQPEQ